MGSLNGDLDLTNDGPFVLILTKSSLQDVDVVRNDHQDMGGPQAMLAQMLHERQTHDMRIDNLGGVSLWSSEHELDCL